MSFRLLCALLVPLAGGCSNKFHIPPIPQADEIVIKKGIDIEYAQITDEVVVEEFRTFVNQHLNDWYRPWYGVPVARQYVVFKQKGKSVGTCGIASNGLERSIAWHDVDREKMADALIKCHPALYELHFPIFPDNFNKKAELKAARAAFESVQDGGHIKEVVKEIRSMGMRVTAINLNWNGLRRAEIIIKTLNIGDYANTHISGVYYFDSSGNLVERHFQGIRILDRVEWKRQKDYDKKRSAKSKAFYVLPGDSLYHVGLQG